MQLRKALFWERFLQALVESSNIQALGAGCENSQAALKGKKNKYRGHKREYFDNVLCVICGKWYKTKSFIFLFVFIAHTV